MSLIRRAAELRRSAIEFLRGGGYKTSEPADYHWELMSDKAVAHLAGLGWIGKCSLLVTEDFGTAVWLSKLLTDAPLPTAGLVVESRCGKCRLCVDACPGRAVFGLNWAPGTHLCDLLDRERCNTAAGRRSVESMGFNDNGPWCTVCVAACPYTRRYARKGEAG